MTLTIMHKMVALIFAGAFIPTTLNVVSAKSLKDSNIKESKIKKIDVYSPEFRKDLKKYKSFFEDFRKEAGIWSQPIESLKKAAIPLIWLANPKNIQSIMNNDWGDHIIASWKEQTGALSNLKAGEWVEVEEEGSN